MPSVGGCRVGLGTVLAGLTGRANRIGDVDSSRGFGERFARMLELKVRGRRRGRRVVVERLKSPRGRVAIVEEESAWSAILVEVCSRSIGLAGS